MEQEAQAVEIKPIKRKLSKKQKKFVAEYAKTGNGTKAALKAYDTTDPKTASVIAVENLAKPSVQAAIKSIADQIPDELLVKVHLEGLEANRVISANITYGDADEKTNDFIEVPDHAVRHKFLDSAFKLKGVYAPEKSLNVNVEVEADDIVEALAEKLNYEIHQGTSEPSDGIEAGTLGSETQGQE